MASVFTSVAKAFEARRQSADSKHEHRAEAPHADPKQLPDSRQNVLSVCGYDLQGVSISGQETCIIVPRLNLAFDIGRCPQQAVFQQTVLISHGHLDHVGGIAFHVTSRSMLRLPPSRVVVATTLAPFVERTLQLVGDVQGMKYEPEVIELQVGQELALAPGYVVRPFTVHHTVPAQGYLLYALRKKLKAALVGRDQAEIRELRLAGEEVTETIEVPELAFTGDTTAELLSRDDLEDVFRARVLIMELTFLDDSVSTEQAREQGHMHIIDFAANAHKFQNEAIVLIHFSPRYKRAQVLESLDTLLPPALRAKCHPFLNGIP